MLKGYYVISYDKALISMISFFWLRDIPWRIVSEVRMWFSFVFIYAFHCCTCVWYFFICNHMVLALLKKVRKIPHHLRNTNIEKEIEEEMTKEDIEENKRSSNEIKTQIGFVGAKLVVHKKKNMCLKSYILQW